MLVFCEECGERYSFSLEDIDPDKKFFPCRKCGFLIRLNRDEEEKVTSRHEEHKEVST
ncbi:MAG: hypothetical protein ACQES8_07435 [Thermodesulfobacteriota bacterium]